MTLAVVADLWPADEQQYAVAFVVFSSVGGSILGGLLGLTSGSIYFDGSPARPPRGTLGIVPQKNVLFPELTCFQTLQVWRAIKAPVGDREEDLDMLLKDCDLGEKIHENAGTLSGGQKRKLQLAIGLVGGSKSESKHVGCVIFR